MDDNQAVPAYPHYKYGTYNMAEPIARDEMTKEQFDKRMAEGLSQAKGDRSTPISEVFSRLIEEIENEKSHHG